MTQERGRWIRELAVLLALGAFVPALAAAQEIPEEIGELETYACGDPVIAAGSLCEDLYDELIADERECRVYCRNVLQTCHKHVVALSRCLDRLNKDLLRASDAQCRGEYPDDPDGRAECRQEGRDFAELAKEQIIDRQALGKAGCRFCYEACLLACLSVPVP